MAEQDEQVYKRMERIAVYLEKLNFGDYVQLLQRPHRIIYLNFLGGLARGVGIGIGFTVLATVLLYLLQKLAVYNLPYIGRFIADLVRIVQAHLYTPTF
ncbi:hypothetical protein DNHGIG_30460 [Collibacillus ludicampi]|uniref:Uncharacterized protein n=1 Tax=Collibacillus ludicampi TaxID=2771369 RepID=A0AAV4LI58_9BACL|nr:DUF5665 domain-containing protein [Collibacillus ludicampi]GIM47497.1 hypothetical protein DNHGIG_30460 [Collibacillus ludicampi]